MIIGISGYIGSGKDTAGEIIKVLSTVKNSKIMEDEFGNPLTDTKGNYVTYPDTYLFQIKKFAEKLKEVASIMTGIPREKFEDHDFKAGNMPEEWWKDGKPITVREFLQRLGTDAIRDVVHVDAWINSAMAGYDSSKHWVFTDCRFPNEAKAIKDRGGIIIRINRYPPGCSPVFMDKTRTEVSLDDWDFDYVIYNVGTLEDLKAQIKEILRRIMPEMK